MTMLIYSHEDLGLTGWLDIFWSSASTSLSPTANPDTLNLSDNDPVFEDESDGAASSQLLVADLMVDGVQVGVSGDVVQHVGQSSITNTTTGESGELIVVQINGEIIGYATTIALHPDDALEISPWLGSLTSTPYDDLIDGPQCFTRGTLITCQHGNIPVEKLQAGDRVWTRDNGLQTIRWVGHRAHGGTGKFAPVCFMKGVLGNTHDLYVSQQHRMLIGGWRAELLFGMPEVLVPALDLINGDTVFLSPADKVEYFHIMFDRHQIITANGSPSESFTPNMAATDALSQDIRKELFALFPELDDPSGWNWPDCHSTLAPGETEMLVRGLGNAPLGTFPQRFSNL